MQLILVSWISGWSTMIYDDLWWSMMIYDVFLNISRCFAWLPDFRCRQRCGVSMFVQRARGIVGTRRDRQGTARDRQVLVFNASKASKEGGVSSLFIQLSTSYQMFWDLSIFQFIKLPRKSNLDRSLELHRINHLHACDGRGSRAIPRIV